MPPTLRALVDLTPSLATRMPRRAMRLCACRRRPGSPDPLDDGGRGDPATSTMPRALASERSSARSVF